MFISMWKIIQTSLPFNAWFEANAQAAEDDRPTFSDKCMVFLKPNTTDKQSGVSKVCLELENKFNRID